MMLQSVAVLATLTLCSAHVGGSLQQDYNHVYCGRSLARALAEICNFQNADKRAEGTMYGAILTPYKELGLPWLTPQKARGLEPRGKRLIAGVVDECCSKPCSLDEMLSYCY